MKSLAAAGALILGAAWWWGSRASPTEERILGTPTASAVDGSKRQPEYPWPVPSPMLATVAPQRADAPHGRVEARETRFDLSPPAAIDSGSTFTVAPPRGRLIDRRNDAGPNAPSEREQLGYAVETLDEDVEACLAEWSKSQVEVSGEVMLAVQIDPAGMKEAWVEREGEVPLGPRSCFANAAYGIDWSHMVDEPVKITRRYTFAADAGR